MSWLEYWNKDTFWSKDEIWKINAEIFLKNSQPLLNFKNSDIVLDYGCGAGHVEKILAPRVEKIFAGDISDTLLMLCRERCKTFENVVVQKVVSPEKFITEIEGEADKAFCISVIQYLENVEKVKELISLLKQKIKTGGVILIADIPLRRNTIQKAGDFFQSLFKSLYRGYFFQFASVIFRSLFFAKDYQKVRKSEKELKLSVDKLKEIVSDLGLNAKVIFQSFSIVANRPSLLIQC